MVLGRVGIWQRQHQPRQGQLWLNHVECSAVSVGCMCEFLFQLTCFFKTGFSDVPTAAVIRTVVFQGSGLYIGR